MKHIFRVCTIIFIALIMIGITYANEVFKKDSGSQVIKSRQLPLTPTSENLNLVPTSLNIYPVRPYAGYVEGDSLDWPEGGFSIQLDVRAEFSGGKVISSYGRSVKWSADNKSVSITPSGVMTSGTVSADTAVTITAAVGSVEATLKVNILDGNLDIATIISDNNFTINF